MIGGHTDDLRRSREHDRPMADSTDPRLCRLHRELGRVETCPGPACPFWDRGAPFGGGCALEELDLAGRPEVAEWLLRIRGQLETAETREEEDQTRDELYRLLSTGDADGG